MTVYNDIYLFIFHVIIYGAQVCNEHLNIVRKFYLLSDRNFCSERPFKYSPWLLFEKCQSC